MKRWIRCGALLAAALFTAAAARAGDCPAAAAGCTSTASFVAQVVDWRTTHVNGTHYASATVRFTNRTTHVLVLAHPRGGSAAVDDQGNRYAVGGVAGIGEIAGGGVDTKFTLQPGESAEARFDFRGPSGGTIVGTRFVLDQTVREVEPLASGQLRLGREHVLHIQGLTSGAIVAAAVAGPAGVPAIVGVAPPVAAPPAPPPIADACAGLAQCSSAGAVAVQVTGLTHTSANNRTVLKLDLRFSNRGNEPVILAYKSQSHSVVDDQGGAYASAQLGVAVAGMGEVRGGSADPQFVLRPGETRSATFSALGYGRRTGTRYTHRLAIEQLQVLPSQQVRTLREYALNFADVAPGVAAPAAVGETAAVAGVQQTAQHLKALLGNNKGN